MRASVLNRSPVRFFATLVAVAAVVACGSSEAGNYFDISNPILDGHSRTMADAEQAMFEVASARGGSDGTVFAFGGDAGTADAFLPIFRDAAKAIERDIAEWDEIEAPEIAGGYHSMIREVMSLRLGVMRDGESALEAAVAGETVKDPFSAAEDAMMEANVMLNLALNEARRIQD